MDNQFDYLYTSTEISCLDEFKLVIIFAWKLIVRIKKLV